MIEEFKNFFCWVTEVILHYYPLGFLEKKRRFEKKDISFWRIKGKNAGFFLFY